MFNLKMSIMRLLTVKRRAGYSKANPDCIHLTKASIGIGPDVIERMNLDENCHLGIGMNDTNRLCLFFTRERHSDLFKLQFNESAKSPFTKRRGRINLSKGNGQALEHLRGYYTVGESRLRSGVFECVLMKKKGNDEE